LLENIPNKVRNKLGIIPSVNIEKRRNKEAVKNDLRILVEKDVLKESGKKGAGAYYVIGQ